MEVVQATTIKNQRVSNSEINFMNIGTKITNWEKSDFFFISLLKNYSMHQKKLQHFVPKEKKYILNQESDT